MTTAALIVAAGRGLRAGGDLPKQWQTLAQKTVLHHSVKALSEHCDLTVVVIHPDDKGLWDAATIDADIVVFGAATRDASVRAGLEALKPHAPQNVLIHDGARPLVPASVVQSVKAALNTHQGAAPAVAVTDALWIGDSDLVQDTQDRNGLYRAQTPQGFHFGAIFAAHANRTTPAADDVQVAREAGMDVAIVPGHEDNIKITSPGDLARAETIMRSAMDVRLGNGFDVHKFGPGDHVWICGVKIPHDHALVGHSDADVGMHAVTDAIYGALGQGDIGQHFPPSDPQWKGAQSHIFLRHAVELAAQNGFKISNVDCTLICEFPKIGPHQDAMKAALAEIMNLSADRISVKATTSEKLGFTGRGEGIASIATATLVSA